MTYNCHRPLSAMRAARLRAGLSGQVVAVRAGLSLQTVLTAERAPGLLTQRTATLVGQVLGVAPESLFGFAADAKVGAPEREEK